jgi:hypothetical protein
MTKVQYPDICDTPEADFPLTQLNTLHLQVPKYGMQQFQKIKKMNIKFYYITAKRHENCCSPLF